MKEVYRQTGKSAYHVAVYSIPLFDQRLQVLQVKDFDLVTVHL